MHTEKQISLFRNGRNQAIRIPKEFELEGTKAIIYKEGNKLIIEPCKKKGLLSTLSELKPLTECLPDIDEHLQPLDDINL